MTRVIVPAPTRTQRARSTIAAALRSLAHRIEPHTGIKLANSRTFTAVGPLRALPEDDA